MRTVRKNTILIAENHPGPVLLRLTERNDMQPSRLLG
jgi:hypothetical protein